MNVTYKDGSLTSTERSDIITGIPACLTSSRIGSQPDWMTGAIAITSTFFSMNERMASNCFSWDCSAFSNNSSIPASSAASLIDNVFALRQSLSDPSCENPTTISREDNNGSIDESIL